MSAIDLGSKSAARKITSTQRSDVSPKSVRLNRADIERLEALKDVLREMTGKENISDTVAMKAALAIAGHASKAAVQKGSSEIL